MIVTGGVKSVMLGTRRVVVETWHHRDGLIGKLQPLNVGQVIGAIARGGAVVDDRDDVIAEIERRTPIVCDDRVFRQVALDTAVSNPALPERISRTATSWPGLYLPASISGIIGAMLSKLAISGPVPSTFWRTLMRTLRPASPSMDVVAAAPKNDDRCRRRQG
jgi:hypothetical protein